KESFSGGFADKTITFGNNGDIPLAGNWTGNGVDYIGVYRPSTATFYLTTSNDQSSGKVVYQFVFGNPNWLPIVGDWTGSHRDSIGAFDPATNLFYLKYALPAPSSSPVGAGYADATISLGNHGDIPIAGKWVASWGHAGIGVFRPGNATFYLSSTVVGGTSATPAGATVLNNPLHFGTTGDLPITGDWNGDGQTGIGVFRPSNNFFYLKDDPITPPGNLSYPAFEYGDAGDKPLAGYWGP
ncbi:MAG TPA: hypothetical protein VKB76_11960, partial [Ktedonobacterales bacterium]|nr:hypothetical protein [Ktedonobacterales bacterium]